MPRDLPLFLFRRESLSLVPNNAFYRNEIFAPWMGFGNFGLLMDHIRDGTPFAPIRCYVIYSLLKQALRLNGEIWEVQQEESWNTKIISHMVMKHQIRIFEHNEELEVPITSNINNSEYNIGDIHRLFSEINTDIVFTDIVFAHIDICDYDLVMKICEKIYPRLMPGGFMVFDDYGYQNYDGARNAVDEYFLDKDEFPLILTTGQAIVFRMPNK